MCSWCSSDDDVRWSKYAGERLCRSCWLIARGKDVEVKEEA
jgi:hypothetical protein